MTLYTAAYINTTAVVGIVFHDGTDIAGFKC